MATATESAANLFEQTFENLRKATKSAFEMQQEMYGQWAKMWPRLGPTNADWTARVQKFQKDWASAVSELMQKHRSLLDQQYRAGIAALEEAFRVTGSKDPEELRDRFESLCRKALDLMIETSEVQMRQFQEAMNKLVELCQTKP